MSSAHEDLEQRVTARYLDLVRPTIVDATEFDWSEAFFKSGTTGLWAIPEPDLPQFPREQWVTYPNRRAVTLVLVDRMLDLWDELTDMQKTHVAMLLTCGGRERIA